MQSGKICRDGAVVAIFEQAAFGRADDDCSLALQFREQSCKGRDVIPVIRLVVERDLQPGQRPVGGLQCGQGIGAEARTCGVPVHDMDGDGALQQVAGLFAEQKEGI